MYLFINSCLFLIIFIVARQRNLEGDFIVVSFFKKNYFYQWFHRREVSLLVKSRSMDKLRSIFFSGVKIAGIVIIPLVSGHQIGPLTCGSYRDGSQTLPLYFIVR